MHDSESSLHAAARALYHTFRNYRGLSTWADPMDITPADDNLSVTRHCVEDLDRRHYHYYGWHAVALGGADSAALKYFFPRVLIEAAFPPHNTAPREGTLPLEMYTEEMVDNAWDQWPDAERAPISVFFDAWFTAALHTPVGRAAFQTSTYKSERFADNVLKFIAFLGLNLRSHLDAWARDESPAATSQLAFMIQTHAPAITTGATLKGWNSFSGNARISKTTTHEAVRFLTSPRTFARLETTFFSTTDPATQAELADAVDTLRATYALWNGNLRGTGTIPRWAEEVAAQMSRTA